MKDIGLGIRLTADAKGFVGEMRISKKQLDKLTGATAKNAAETRRASSATKNFGGTLSSIHKKAISYGASIITVTQAIRALNGVAETTIRQEQALAQVEARLKSTGHASGLVTEQLAEIAAKLQDVTTFGDEAILEMQSLLLSFRSIEHQ